MLTLIMIDVQDLEKWPDAVKYNYLHVYGRPLLEQLSKEWVTAMNQYQDQGIILLLNVEVGCNRYLALLLHMIELILSEKIVC